jgi:hypothetical protein
MLTHISYSNIHIWVYIHVLTVWLTYTVDKLSEENNYGWNRLLEKFGCRYVVFGTEPNLWLAWPKIICWLNHLSLVEKFGSINSVCWKSLRKVRLSNTAIVYIPGLYLLHIGFLVIMATNDCIYTNTALVYIPRPYLKISTEHVASNARN